MLHNITWKWSRCTSQMIHVEASNAIIHLQDSFDNSALLVLWRAGFRCDIVWVLQTHTHTQVQPSGLHRRNKISPVGQTLIMSLYFLLNLLKKNRLHKKTQLSCRDRAKSATPPTKYELLWCVQTGANALGLGRQGVICFGKRGNLSKINSGNRSRWFLLYSKMLDV